MDSGLEDTTICYGEIFNQYQNIMTETAFSHPKLCIIITAYKINHFTAVIVATNSRLVINHSTVLGELSYKHKST